MDEYQAAQPRSQLVLHCHLRQPVLWSPPPRTNFKINFNGAVFQDKGTTSSGVIIQDNRGLVITSMFENFALPHSIVDLEAIAAGRALAFFLEVGIFSAILEGDSAIVINALKD